MKKTATGSKSEASRQITDYIDNLGDWRSATLAKLREVILKASPNITEAWKWGTPVWEANNGLVCVAGAFKGHVKLTFHKGAMLNDPRQVFNASLEAGAWRALDIHEGEVIDVVGLKGLVRDAVALNAIVKKRK